MNWKEQFSEFKLLRNRVNIFTLITIAIFSILLIVSTSAAQALTETTNHPKVAATKSSSKVSNSEPKKVDHRKLVHSKLNSRVSNSTPKNKSSAIYHLERFTFVNQATTRLAPSMALVETIFTSRLSVPAPSLDQNAVSSLEDALAQQVANGSIPNNQSSIQNALVNAIDKSPLEYLKPTSDIQTTLVQALEVGSGWIVSPNGYIVVPAQIVKPSSVIVQNAFDFEGIANLAKLDSKELDASTSGTLNPSQIALLSDAASKYNAQYIRIGHITSQTTVQLDNAVFGIEDGRKGLVAKIVARSLNVSNKNIGSSLLLLKANGLTNLDSIDLASLPASLGTGVRSTTPPTNKGRAAAVKIAEVGNKGRAAAVKIAEVGYNSNSDFASYASPSEHIQVSGIGATLVRKSTQSTQTLLIGSPLNSGSVGSMIVNHTFQPIAMVTNPGLGQFTSNLAGTSIAISATEVRSFVDEALHNQPSSPTKTLYQSAFNDWFAHHFSDALPKFETISSISPRDPYAKHYEALARLLIAQGQDRSGTSNWTLIVLSLIIFTALAVFAAPRLLSSLPRRSHHFKHGYRSSHDDMADSLGSKELLSYNSDQPSADREEMLT